MSRVLLAEIHAQLFAQLPELQALPPAERQQRLAVLDAQLAELAAHPVLRASFRFLVSGELADGLALLAELQRPAHRWERRRRYYWQFYGLLFRAARLRQHALERALRPWYRQLFAEFCQRLGALPAAAPSAEDCPPVVLVIVNQLLLPRHAPTADTLDTLAHCRALGYAPFLINAADVPDEELWEFFDSKCFARVADYAEATVIEHAGEVFPFYQCRAVADDVAEARRVLQAIAETRPRFVLCLGHSCLLADACRAIAPVITAPFTVEVAATCGQGLVLRRPPTAEDQELLAALGEPPPTWIVEPYTYAPLPPHPPTTRAALGLPGERYALAVVGSRLDDEMDELALSWLAAALRAEPRLHLAIIGTWENWPRIAAQHGWQERATYLGYRSDLPAVLAVCDGFLNPRRQGGGTSVAWALACGLQVLSGDAGDGALAAGPERIVRSAEEIVSRIQRWLADPAWRAAESAAARARFAALSDRRASIARILEFGERLRLDCGFTRPG
ncbi:MAG: glycosyltransferase [Planctomycetota bacterium]|nr:glycosyltransferase [Planctomycetota bacterium]